MHGEYVNGEPNKPLFVSALVYLNDTWPDRWDAETLFMDGASSTGVFVRPRPGRLVLMAGRVFFFVRRVNISLHVYHYHLYIPCA